MTMPATAITTAGRRHFGTVSTYIAAGSKWIGVVAAVLNAACGVASWMMDGGESGCDKRVAVSLSAARSSERADDSLKAGSDSSWTGFSAGAACGGSFADVSAGAYRRQACKA